MALNELEPRTESEAAPTTDCAGLRETIARLHSTDSEFRRQCAMRGTIASAAADALARRGDILLIGAGVAAAGRVVRAAESKRRVIAIEFGSAALTAARGECDEADVEWRDGFDAMTRLDATNIAGCLGVEFLALDPDPERRLRAIHDALAPGAEFRFVTDFYAENTAVHRWRRAFGLPYRLLSNRGWIGRFERAGFREVSTSRIRVDGLDPWRATRGSLVVRGVREGR